MSRLVDYHLPDATVSEEQAIQAWNEDIPDLTPSERLAEAHRAARLAERDPRRIVWRGREPVSARQWADERVELLLGDLPPGRKP